ncbi:complex I NDUFA9 subunit family protein [uncultured Cohaesibacter sp.]|uniref:complex I NDUFA9 subunit family protein n=1 Tax=uncultured Cohaesibacter sp. TaxID=1002546 RepID=UPI0029C91772|nr:complex I NDUFA9 subunit family protein [uncultured Cohaesibacter sp.]
MNNSTGKIVTVFGGSGFLGRHVVRALALKGYRVRVAVRRPDLAGFLQPLGNVGQVMPMQANLRDANSVARAVEGADAVVNLVGILYETGKQSFDAVHHIGANTIAEAAARAGISKLVQISAIGASEESAAGYARSKALGEEAALAAVPSAIVIRPSLLIGSEDNFFNKFAEMARISPFLPLIGGGLTKFQPVFVGDVANVIARGVDGLLKPGATYELGGPDVRTFRELMDMMMAVTHQQRMLLPIPFWLAGMMGSVFQSLPVTPPLTRDQVTMLKSDNVVSELAKAEGRTFEGLEINPMAIEAVIPTYLWSYRSTGQYEANRVQ